MTVTTGAPRTPRRGVRVPSRAERVLSWTILAALPIVAGGVYLKGRVYDPHLFALNPASLAARPIATTSPPPAVRVARDPDLPPASTLPSRLAALDWEADGPAEAFTRDTLYQKIDGRADVYLQDGFARLDTISYARGSAFIDVFVYDMTDAVHARTRFAAERPRQSRALPLDTDAYCASASCFFAEGRYYVQVIGSDPGDEVARAVENVAREVLALTKGRQP